MIGGHDPRDADREERRHEQGREEPLPIQRAAWSRVLFPLGLAAIVALGLGAQLASVPSADIAFLLYAAGRVLDGARLYVDIVEINPPLIVALNVPAVALGRVTGVSEVTAYRVLVALTMLAALAVVGWCLRRSFGSNDGPRRLLVMVFAAALFLAAGDDFGQREHLLVALTLPYVLLAEGRLRGRPAPIGLRVIAGALAGVGVGLKPHFLIMLLAVEGLVSWRRRTVRVSPEAIGAAAFLAAYAAAVALATPEYFRLVRLLGSAYGGYGHYSFLQVLVTAPGVTLCALAALAYAALRREGAHGTLWTALLIALIAVFVAATAQQKGWGYHFYPARTFALGLLALVVVDTPRPLRRPVQQVYRAVALGALGTVVITSAALALSRVARLDPGARLEAARLERLVAAVRHYVPPGGGVYVMSYTIESGFPLVNYSGVRWDSRFPHLWILEAVYQDRLYSPKPLRFHARDRMGVAERYLDDAVYEDLARRKPDLLMVLRQARDVPDNAVRRLDYLAYFERDPRIAGELRHYRLAGEVDEYRLYVRVRAPDVPGQRPGPLPGRYDVARTGPRTAGKLLLGDTWLLLNGLTFLLLAGAAFARERRHAHGRDAMSARHVPA